MATINKFSISKDRTALDVVLTSTPGRKFIGSLSLFNPIDPGNIYEYNITVLDAQINTLDDYKIGSNNDVEPCIGAKVDTVILPFECESPSDMRMFMNIDAGNNQIKIVFLTQASIFIELFNPGTSFNGFVILPAGTQIIRIVHFADENVGHSGTHNFTKDYEYYFQTSKDYINESIDIVETGLTPNEIYGFINERVSIGSPIDYRLNLEDTCYQLQALTFIIKALNELLPSYDSQDVRYTRMMDDLNEVYGLMNNIDLAYEIGAIDEGLAFIDSLKKKLLTL